MLLYYPTEFVILVTLYLLYLSFATSVKPQLENYENRMYHGVAFIVRWIDFDSKGAGREMPHDKNKITDTIRLFEVALAEVVRLVYQCHVQNGMASANHQRR